MKIVKEAVYKVEFAPGEFRQRFERCRNLPETKAMMTEIAAERKAWVENLVAQIDAQKKR